MFDWYYADYGYLFSPIIKQLLELVISSLDVVVAAHIIYVYIANNYQFKKLYLKLSWLCLLKIPIFKVSHFDIKNINSYSTDFLLFSIFDTTSTLLFLILLFVLAETCNKILSRLIQKQVPIKFLICSFALISISLIVYLKGTDYLLALLMFYVFLMLFNIINMYYFLTLLLS